MFVVVFRKKKSRHPGAGRDPLRRRHLCRRECDTYNSLDRHGRVALSR